MHINDERNIPALGRVGDPDDIIGTVLVQDGSVFPALYFALVSCPLTLPSSSSQIASDTYQSMPSYRLCTSDGLTRLTPSLAEKLRKVLQQVAHASIQE
jgi:hypothetical protein